MSEGMSMYPRMMMIQDHREVELWPMTADDAPALLEFYRSLPAEDLLYLREDVTRREAMDRWVDGIESEQVWHLLAGWEGRIIADGELDFPYYGWTRHVGEVRLVVARGFRGTGLSRMMFRELLAQALDEGLHKVIVQMMLNQHAAIHMCTKLGFRQEAVLSEHVQDQHGHLCDMVIMAYYMRNFSGQYEMHGWEESTERL
jgi:RimJ/RimL family protein N-acetyltransferase